MPAGRVEFIVVASAVKAAAKGVAQGAIPAMKVQLTPIGVAAKLVSQPEGASWQVPPVLRQSRYVGIKAERFKD